MIAPLLAAAAALLAAAPPPPLPAVPPAPPPPRFQEQVLASGLRVVAVEARRRPVVALRLVLPHGSADDPARQGGAGLLALLLATDYRERDERGTDLAGEKSLRREAVDLGGALSAELEPDHAVLEASGYAADLPRLLGLLAAAVVDPRHGAESFRGRRGAILDAIEDVEASDPEALERLVAEAAFGAGHPYARRAWGARAEVKVLGLEDVVAHQERLLAPAGATLLVVGDVEAGAALAAARRAFGRWRREGLAAAAPPPPVLPAGGAEVAFLARSPAATLLACATRPLPDVRGEDAALDLLAAVLGDGAAARLPALLREETGLSYHAMAAVVRRRGARAFLACAPLAAARAEEGVRRMRDALAALRREPPAAAELERARAVRLAALEAGQDGLAPLLEAWTRAVVRGEGTPRPEAERAALARVTAADLQRLARTVLDPRTTRWILSGDREAAGRAAAANDLGALAPLALGR